MYSVTNVRKVKNEKGTDFIELTMMQPEPMHGPNIYRTVDIGISFDMVRELKELLESVDKGDDQDE